MAAPSNKAALYQDLESQLAGLYAGERHGLANTANLAAILFRGLPSLNWAGFYFLQGDELILGPFQGKVACVRIPMGKGVCGSAAARREVVIVGDVHQFPGHIACDVDSLSEIVVPVLQDDCLIGVLDLDSPQLNRFDAEDSVGLEVLIDKLVAASDLGWLTTAR